MLSTLSPPSIHKHRACLPVLAEHCLVSVLICPSGKDVEWVICSWGMFTVLSAGYPIYTQTQGCNLRCHDTITTSRPNFGKWNEE